MTISLRAVRALTTAVVLLGPAPPAHPSRLLRAPPAGRAVQPTPARPRSARASLLSFGALSPGQRIEGFRSVAVYLNAADRPMGARFIHQRSGFVLDLLQIQSVPQGFIWAITLPTSDMGEPHTQEHLLLGKGSKGRSFSSQ